MKQFKFIYLLPVTVGILSCCYKTNQQSNPNTTDSTEKEENQDINEFIKCKDSISKLVFEPTYSAGEGPCDSGFTHRLIILADCVTIRGRVDKMEPKPPIGDGDRNLYIKLGEGYEKILNEINPNGSYAKFRELVCPIKPTQVIHCEIIWVDEPNKLSSMAYNFYKENHLENWKNPVLIPNDGDSVEVRGRLVIDLSYTNSSDSLKRCFKPEYEIHPITELTIFKDNR